MDKNTLLGLLLMMLVIFGFMYLNRPSEEELAQQRAEQLAAAKADAPKAENQALSFDTLSAAEVHDLAVAIRLVGTPENGTYSLKNRDLEVAIDPNDRLEGTVRSGADRVEINSALAASAGLDYDRQTRLNATIRNFTQTALRYRGFARYMGGDANEVVLENDLVKLTLSSLGGYISQVELKKYDTERTDPPTPIRLFAGSNDGYGFRFIADDQRIDTRELNFSPVVTDSTVTMVVEPAAGAKWGIRYTLRPDSYVVSMDIIQQGMADVLPASTASIDFDWHQRMGRNEVGRTFEERNSGIFYKYIGSNPDELNTQKNAQKDLNGRIRWVAFKNQFFSSVIVAKNYFSTTDVKSTVISDDNYLKDLSMAASLPYTAADGVGASFDFFFGPNEYPLLAGLDDTIDAGEDLKLTRLIPLGWSLFRWINTGIIIPVFTFLGKYLTNYGLIILLLTIFIKLLIFPFTFKSFKSQARMRVLNPEIMALNEKYPGQENAMKRQQETMALYNRAGASPFSGCLPMLLQMPVLIAMFSFFPSAIELRGQSFLWAHDLSAPDYVLALPFKIPFYGDHVSLFCLLMTIVNIVYMHVNMQSQPTNSSMPSMKWMSYLMPIMFLFIFNDYASGLSYYYLLSMFITILQTWIFRKVVNEDKVRAEMAENAKKPRKKSGLMARLEAAQKQQEALMRQQAREQAKRRH